MQIEIGNTFSIDFHGETEKETEHTQVSRELDPNWRRYAGERCSSSNDIMTPIVASILPPLCHIAAVEDAIFCYRTSHIHTTHTRTGARTQISYIYSDTKWTEIINHEKSIVGNRTTSNHVKKKKTRRETVRGSAKNSGKLKTHFHRVRRFVPIVHIFQCMERWVQEEKNMPNRWLVSLYFLASGSLLYLT